MLILFGIMACRWGAWIAWWSTRPVIVFGVRFTAVLSQWHIKDPGHSAKSSGGRLHLNTHTSDRTKSEWADYAAVQA